jgi:hypothetical protein
MTSAPWDFSSQVAMRASTVSQSAATLSGAAVAAMSQFFPSVLYEGSSEMFAMTLL